VPVEVEAAKPASPFHRWSHRWSFGLAAVVASAVVVITLLHIVRDLPNYTGIVTSDPSGTWTGLAVDLANGEFYRPLVSDDGFGGTRYFPLHVVLHASAIKLGLGPVVAGHLISLGSLIAILVAAYLLLRRMGVQRSLSVCACTLTLGLYSQQLALIEVRGDLLPAALNLWGLVVFVSNRVSNRGSNRPGLGLTAALFTLAFLAKMTTVFGAVAVALSLLFAGQRKTALRFVGWMALGCTAGLLVVHIASGGRALQAITAVASGGASWVQILLRAPLLMLKIVLPSDLILAVLALGTAAGLPGQERRDVLPLAVLTTGFITLVMYGSPGVDRNHLIDFDFIAMVFLVASGARGRIPLAQAMTGLSLAVLIVVPTILRQPPPQRTTIEKVIAETRSGSGPLLVENPWWAILAGERPFMLDAFNLRIMADRDPEVARALYTRLDTRFFRAVILEMPIDQPEFIWGDRWYGDVHFGKEFPEHLTANYDLVTTYPGARGSSYFIWRPKASSTSKHGE
jgi:hypothetical protein